MRVLVAILMLVLAGCADYPEFETEAFMDEPVPQLNSTAPVPANGTPDPIVYPVATIATAPMTAPVNVTLHRVDGDAATLLLVADAQGLRCISVPHDDPAAAPSGYRAVGSWARCSLLVDGTEHTSAKAASMASDMPLLQDIPVEAFTWNMSVGQVLVNNTGEHDKVLDEVSATVLAAPELGLGHSIRQDGIRTSSRYVCDTFLTWGIADVVFTAEAHNGRAFLMVDATDFDVVHVEASGTEVSPENATRDGTNATWWREESKVFVLGPWAHESEAQVSLTIAFRGKGNSLAFLPPLNCPDAVFRDLQGLPFEAHAAGIAAGWQDEVVEDLLIQVWHT